MSLPEARYEIGAILNTVDGNTAEVKGLRFKCADLGEGWEYYLKEDAPMVDDNNVIGTITRYYWVSESDIMEVTNGS